MEVLRRSNAPGFVDGAGDEERKGEGVREFPLRSRPRESADAVGNVPVGDEE